MPIRTVSIAACLVAAALMTPVAWSRPAARPDACKLLAAALKRGGGVWKHHLHLDRGGNWTSCHYSDGTLPGPGVRWSLSFSFIPEPSVAAARTMWQTVWRGWVGTTGEGLSVARLRGFGADNSFGYEKRTEDPSATDTEIFWQKGRYYGQLEVAGGGRLGDFEDAESFLKALMPGIPRS